MNIQEMGDLIRRRRESMNLRQEDLSELSQVSGKTIHLIEQGIGNPSLKTIEKVAAVLGLEMELKIKSIK